MKEHKHHRHNHTFRDFWIGMFMSSDSVSSKRVMGVIGWAVCLFVSVYCVINKEQAPDIIDLLFYCSAGLLGLDSITAIGKRFEQRAPQKEDKEEEAIKPGRTPKSY